MKLLKVGSFYINIEHIVEINRGSIKTTRIKTTLDTYTVYKPIEEVLKELENIQNIRGIHGN